MAESMDKEDPCARTDHNLNSINGTNGTDKQSALNGDEGAGASSKNVEIDVEYLDTPIKSDVDKREYKVIKLRNGLTALLISNMRNKASTNVEEEDDDVQSEDWWPDEFRDFQKDCTFTDPNQASCVLYIDAGNVDDPPEVPGFSRFTEMIGVPQSEKYQEIFKDYVETHNHGQCHTYVHCEQTEFYFSTRRKNLRRALDHFAESFVSPVIEQRTIAEMRSKLVEGCTVPYALPMKEQLLESLARDGHPAKKFVRKSFEAQSNLTDEMIHNELLKYRKRHYSAHRMTLAVETNRPLHVLIQHVKDCFSSIPNNELPADDLTAVNGTSAFESSIFRRIYKSRLSKGGDSNINIDENYVIELNWQMESLNKLYKSKPHLYVSGIMGQEGKGSLISYLRNKKWCVDISIGVGTSPYQNNSIYSLFKIVLTLTDEGHRHLKQVLDAIYSYINLMRKEGPQERMYDEVRKIQSAKFSALSKHIGH